MHRRFFPLQWLVVYAALILPSLLNAQVWRIVESGVTSTLNDVQFINKHVGYICGDDSTILKTTNGGETWFPLTLGFKGDIKALSFTNEQYGWLAVTSVVGGPRTGNVYNTTDGGQTWISGSLGYSVLDIDFVDRDSGWVIGYNHNVFHTTNGGTDWIDKSEGLWGVFNTCSFINGTEGWIAGAHNGHDNFDEEVIWHTTDGGETWEFQEIVDNFGPLYTIDVLPSGVGFAYGWQGIKTTDRGTTWTNAGGRGTAIYILDESHVYLARTSIPDNVAYYYMLFSSDTGRTWVEMEREDGGRTEGIYFVDPNYGFAVGTSGKIWMFDTTTVGIEHIPPQVSNHLLSHAYPNPVHRGRNNEFVTITISGKVGGDNILCYISDIFGHSITINPQIDRAKQGLELKFDSYKFVPGVYFYRISDENRHYIIANGLFHIIQ